MYRKHSKRLLSFKQIPYQKKKDSESLNYENVESPVTTQIARNNGEQLLQKLQV